MKKLALLFAVALLASFLLLPQQVENFSCSQADAISLGASTTTITCNEAHQFENEYAKASLEAIHLATNGRTATLEGKVYTFVTALNNANDGEVLIESGVVTNGVLTGTTMNLYNAVNDTGVGEGTKYSSATTAHSTWVAYKPGSTSRVFFRYNTAGTAGNGKAMSAQSPMQWNSGTLGAATSSIYWFVKLSAGTGDYAGLGSNATPAYYRAKYVSSTSFSIVKNTAAYTPNYATYLSGGAAKIEIARANFASQAMFQTVANTQGDLTQRIPVGSHTLELDVPDCPVGSTEIECSRGYWNPDNQKAYMVDRQISSFVVSGGTITITFTSAFTDNTAGGFEALAVGRLIHIRGLQQYATATNPGYDGSANDPAQPCAAAFAKNVGSQTSRGFYVQSVAGSSGSYTGITINNPSDCPLQNGTYILSCTPAGACIGRTQANGFVAITWRASAYLYMTPRGSSAHIAPDGYMSYYVPGEIPDVDNNRLTVYTKFCGVDNPRDPSGGLDFNIGTYPQTVLQDTAGSGSHFYHYYNLSIYNCQWVKFELTGTPDHQVGASGGINWPGEPLLGHILYPQFAGGPRKYMDGLTILYMDPVAYKGPWAGNMVIGPPVLSKTLAEPEEYVRGRSIVYSAERYLPSDSYAALQADAGYDVNWQAAPVAGITYDVVYTTSATDLRTLGWSGATSGGTVTPPGLATGYTGAWWQSPTMAEVDRFQVGVRPRVPVKSTTGNGVNPILITTTNDLNLEAGNTVTIASVGGNTNANQTNVALTAVHPRQFWWRFAPQPSGTWSTPGTLTSVVASSGACTANFTEAHNLIAGRVIEIQGSTNIVLSGALPSGAPSSVPKYYTVASVPTSDTLTFTCTGVPNGTYNADHSSGIHFGIQALPAVAISATGNGAYTSGGTIISTGEDTGYAVIELSPYNPLGGAPPSPPDAPSGLSATADGETEIDLAWTDNSDDEDSFEIQRCQGVSCSNYSALTSKAADSESHSDASLSSGTTYGYRVRAVNAGGASAWITASAATDEPVATPTAPSGLAAPFHYDDKMVLTWTDNASNETGFVLQVDSGGGYADACTAGVNVTSCEVIGLTPSTSYNWQVKAVNDAGSSSYTSPLAAATLASMPVTILNQVATGAILSLVAPDGDACSGRIQSNPTGSYIATFTIEGGVRNRRYVLTGLSELTPYTIDVQCSIAGWTGSIQTVAAMGGLSPVSISAPRPTDAVDADNFVVWAGADAGSLAHLENASCSDPTRCRLTVNISPDAPLLAQRRWCINRANDPTCATESNIVSRSKYFSLSVRQ